MDDVTGVRNALLTFVVHERHAALPSRPFLRRGRVQESIEGAERSFIIEVESER